jgi:multiple sugar transport system permease protein
VAVRLSNRGFALLLMTPAAAFLLALVAWPLVRLVVDSLYTSPVLGSGQRSFIGLHNYATAIGSSRVRSAALRTLLYTTFVVSAEFVLGLTAALLFHTLGNASRVLRTVFLYPLMIAPVVAGLLWRFLMIDNFGIVNVLLVRVGLLGSTSSISWLSNPHIVLFSVALPDIWLTTSFMTLVLFAGLQAMPGDVLEAASLDGARGWRLLWRVIIPMLRPVIAVALIIRGVDAARAFDVILIQTNGGPQQASETLSLTTYLTMIRFGDVGQASAISVMFLIAMLLAAVAAILTIWRPGGEQT